MKASTSINKDNLLHCGTCLGKFTKSGKFRLHITALDYLAQYSKVSCTPNERYSLFEEEIVAYVDLLL
jgi:ribosome biogenesis protein Nip4